MDVIFQIILGLFSVLPGNYSGIANIDNHLYALVDDKERVDGFKFLTLDIDSVTGKVLDAHLSEPVAMAERRQSRDELYRDCEGIAYCAATNTIFVSGEEDQQILEYSMDGQKTGRALRVPAIASRSNIMPNLGFEALTYSKVQHRFWTTTESALLSDRTGVKSSSTQSAGQGNLRLMSFSDDLSAAEMYAYQMDEPEIRKKPKTYAHGVPSVVALDDGRLLVMEREANIKKHYLGSKCRIKIYVTDPRQGVTIGEHDRLTDLPASAFLEKKLVGQFTTNLRIGKMNFANYEGMCLGPRLADGRQTIILIADSQNGAGNRLYRLKDYLRVVSLNL